jgi:membrane protease YdiL (CAAX protease family)
LAGRAEVATLLAVLGYSVVVTRAVPSRGYVPANVAAAAAAVAVASRAGVARSTMGLRPARLRRGTRVGLAAGIPVAAAIAAAAALPATRRFFYDERTVRGGRGYALYEGVVRIPLGTALAEEVIFRGALMGWLLHRRSPAYAVVVSSGLFGLWHILPTLDGLRMNPVGELINGSRSRTAGALAAVVVSTAAAGCAFAWLRLRSGSVLAPAIAHTTMNAGAFAAGRFVARSRAPAGPSRPTAAE